MSLSKWQDNISLLESIVNETIQEDNLPKNMITDIFNQFNTMKDYYTKRRLDYNSYDDVNREFLLNMNNYIQTVKTTGVKQEVSNMVTQIGDNHMSLTPAGQDQGNMNYTKDQLMNARMNQFEKQLKTVTDDFNEHQTKKPAEIDFSDKKEEPLGNMDSLLELEMKKREYDLKNINEQDKKKAEAWFSNPDKVQIETLPIIEPNKIKIDITETSSPEQSKAKLQSILKKVSFQETTKSDTTRQPLYSNEPKNVKVDSVLKRLQDEREQLIPYDKPNVETTNNNNFKTKTAIPNKSSSNLSLAPGKPIINNEPLQIQPPIVYNYNTLLINKHYLVSRYLPFFKSPINVSLNTLKQIVIELSKNGKVIHSSHAFQYDIQNSYIHYKLILPYKKENNDLTIKLYDLERTELIPSLNIDFEKEEIISENMRFLFNGLPFDGIDIDSICVIKVKYHDIGNENLNKLESLTNKELWCDSNKIGEFTMFSVSNVERTEKEIKINILEFNNNKYEYLIVNKKYVELLDTCDYLSVKSSTDIVLLDD